MIPSDAQQDASCQLLHDTVIPVDGWYLTCCCCALRSGRGCCGLMRLPC